MCLYQCWLFAHEPDIIEQLIKIMLSVNRLLLQYFPACTSRVEEIQNPSRVQASSYVSCVMWNMLFFVAIFWLIIL